MGGTLEREVKLRFDSADAARAAVVSVGGTLVQARRLQADAILDTEAGALREAQCVLRVRVEPGAGFLTFKGPPQPSMMKLREELETSVGDGALALVILERLGYRVAFRYEKYREEYALHDVLVAIDDTPVGAFVEIEGSDSGIAKAAALLGRGPQDYVLDSYRTLFVQNCLQRGVQPGDMVFPR